MLQRTFNPKLPHRAVLYLRMSSELQNKRSPEQQQQEITTRLRSLGYDWPIVRVYRDDAKSGRYIRKRPGYQQMLQEIRSGTLHVDLILVDTLERFGRVDELSTIRKQLFERHGVLVLTADSNFADPTSVQGKALSMVESMRATEHGRILGHNVLRGKRDAARQKHWPGGAPPFGYQLQNVMREVNGREEVEYRKLVPNPTTSWIIALLFQKAAETGWGTTRLARFLNRNSDIPATLKPFKPETLGYWLDSEIYFGELVWEKNSTGIVDDMRVIERNPTDAQLRVPDFCEPLVAHELWKEVQRLRDARRAARAVRHRSDDVSGKQIVPLAPGMTLKYLLSGLVFCGDCGLRMTASSSAEYTTKAGERRRYVSYVCPGYIARHCSNAVHVPEQWLREQVVAKLREYLFPTAE